MALRIQDMQIAPTLRLRQRFALGPNQRRSSAKATRSAGSRRAAAALGLHFARTNTVTDDGMFRAIGQSWALLLGMFLLMIGNGLQGTVLGVRGDAEGFSASVLGFVMSAYFVGFLGGTQATPWLLRRVGHVRGLCGTGQPDFGGLHPLCRGRASDKLAVPAPGHRVLLSQASTWSPKAG